MWSSLRRAIRRPTTHTLLDSPHGASRAREILGNIALTQVSSSQLHFPFAFQSPWSRRPSMCADSRLPSVRVTLGKYGETARSTRRPEQTCRRAVTVQGDLERKWNTRNWRMEAGISRSDTPQHRPRGKLLGKKLSPDGRSGRRRAANRSQRNWFAATAGAMIWLRVLSSGGIADAGSASANAMDHRHVRGRRSSRSSLTTTWEGDRARKGLGPFSFRATSATMLTDIRLITSSVGFVSRSG